MFPVPRETQENHDLQVSPSEAARFLAYGFGGGFTVQQELLLAEPIFVL